MNLYEKAKSKAQQRLMAMAYALKKGDLKIEDVEKDQQERIQKIANQMTLKDLKDYAETETTDLPDKIKEELELLEGAIYVKIANSVRTAYENSKDKNKEDLKTLIKTPNHTKVYKILLNFIESNYANIFSLAEMELIKKQKIDLRDIANDTYNVYKDDIQETNIHLNESKFSMAQLAAQVKTAYEWGTVVHNNNIMPNIPKLLKNKDYGKLYDGLTNYISDNFGAIFTLAQSDYIVKNKIESKDIANYTVDLFTNIKESKIMSFKDFINE